jgi:hypothetical protein
MATGLRRRGEIDYAPPRNDAYVVLLIISLVAMILGCALLWLDSSSYPEGKPQPVSLRQPAPPQPAGNQPVQGQDQGKGGPAPPVEPKQ